MTLRNILLEDMDIVGEYIINMCNLNMKTEICDLAYKELLKSQLDDGAFPGPNRKGFEDFGMPDKKKDKKKQKEDYFKRNYHTTLVALMASIFYVKYKNQ